MCRAAFAATGGAFLTLFVGAATVDATAAENAWYVVALWVGAGLTLALFLIVGLTCFVRLAMKHLKAVRIRDDWRCTYWTKEQQLKVALWFDDRLCSTRYEAACVARVGQETIRLDDDIELGGMYMGRRRLISGHSGPVMAEFLKLQVRIDPTEHAIISVRIQPRDPWGAPTQETKTVPIQVVSH